MSAMHQQGPTVTRSERGARHLQLRAIQGTVGATNFLATSDGQATPLGFRGHGTLESDRIVYIMRSETKAD